MDARPSFASLVILARTLVACSGSSAPAPVVVAPQPHPAPVGIAKVLAFDVSPENLRVDKVGLRDGYQRPDGNRDLAFTTTIQGPVDALFVVTTNQKGEPGYGLRADTLVANEEIPAELGGVIDTGKMTVGIGVTETGSPKFINGDTGALHLGDGIHKLTLYIPNTATLRAGSFVRLYVKSGDALVPGPITPY